MQESIFTKIINSQVPCHKVYEDKLTFAFMDINPVQPGHVLVVPKAQIDHFDDLDDASYRAVWDTVKKIAKAQKKVFKTKRIGVQVVGLDVPHAHVHLIPFNTVEEYRFVPPNQEPNHDELARNAQKIKDNL
jgi:histidine triad (HIT) family protein